MSIFSLITGPIGVLGTGVESLSLLVSSRLETDDPGEVEEFEAVEDFAGEEVEASVSTMDPFLSGSGTWSPAIEDNELASLPKGVFVFCGLADTTEVTKTFLFRNIFPCIFSIISKQQSGSSFSIVTFPAFSCLIRSLTT